MIGYREIEPYIAQQLVSMQSHPAHPSIRIFNYTARCQYSRAWDHVTRRCRGLILNIDTDAILANPFEKFFNYGEFEGPIPDERPVISEKLDGSLGITYRLPGESLPRVATRGSFTSSQAQWATQWLRQHQTTALDPYITHLFEIIYPENRVVVRYDFSDLVYLAGRVTATGEELPRASYPHGFRKARLIPETDLKTLSEMDEPNSEGFVLHYPVAHLRLKIKFAQYLRLHRVICGLSVKAIWEALRDGVDLTPLVAEMPDEFYVWFSRVIGQLSDHYQRMEAEALRNFQRIRDRLPADAPRKSWADEITQYPTPYLLFALLDQKPYAPMIWKAIRPSYGDQTFREDDV